jgi:hypothetical protein
MISQRFWKKLKVLANSKSKIRPPQLLTLSHRGEALCFRQEQGNPRLVRSGVLRPTAMIRCFASGQSGVIKPGFSNPQRSQRLWVRARPFWTKVTTCDRHSFRIPGTTMCIVIGFKRFPGRAGESARARFVNSGASGRRLCPLDPAA